MSQFLVVVLGNYYITTSFLSHQRNFYFSGGGGCGGGGCGGGGCGGG